MKIKQILSQSRRDFTAVYACESCGFEKVDRGYDDDNFHRNVVPRMICDQCGKQATPDYRPLTTKYQPWEVV